MNTYNNTHHSTGEFLNLVRACIIFYFSSTAQFGLFWAFIIKTNCACLNKLTFKNSIYSAQREGLAWWMLHII